jgi:hypothetical protein
VNVVEAMDQEILEFRAENFQQLLAPPRRKEFDCFLNHS